jgi:anti-sigma factor RsiW
MPSPHASFADDPQLTAELVAYLDGELDADASRRIEELLASSPEVRERLIYLERAWDLLDELPRACVGDVFTRSTIEMVAVKQEEELVGGEAQGKRGWMRAVLPAAALAAAGLMGWLGLHLLWPDPNRELLEDLPVVEHLDPYQQVGDIEFLRRLQAEGLFAEEESDAF